MRLESLSLSNLHLSTNFPIVNETWCNYVAFTVIFSMGWLIISISRFIWPMKIIIVDYFWNHCVKLRIAPCVLKYTCNFRLDNETPITHVWISFSLLLFICVLKAFYFHWLKLLVSPRESMRPALIFVNLVKLGSVLRWIKSISYLTGFGLIEVTTIVLGT